VFKPTPQHPLITAVWLAAEKSLPIVSGRKIVHAGGFTFVEDSDGDTGGGHIHALQLAEHVAGVSRTADHVRKHVGAA